MYVKVLVFLQLNLYKISLLRGCFNFECPSIWTYRERSAHQKNRQWVGLKVSSEIPFRGFMKRLQRYKSCCGVF